MKILIKTFLILICVPGSIRLVYAQNTFPSSGKVGIGTLNPLNQLDVVGNVSVGNSASNTQAKLIINGPWTPFDSTSKRDLSFEFAQAGTAAIRSFRGGSWDTYLQFLTSSYNSNGIPSVRMQIDGNGNLGIGTNDSKGYKLAVAGSVVATSITVKALNSWPDYIFSSTYHPIPLNALENYIKLNKHLPEIETEGEIVKSGIDVGKMNIKLLAKIEELTLYMIEEHKENLRRYDQLKVQLKRFAKHKSGRH